MGQPGTKWELMDADFVPQEIADKVIAAHKPHHEEEHEAATA